MRWFCSNIVTVLVFLSLVAAIGVEARANDTTFYGAGSNLIPIKETRVRMVDETIAMTYDESKGRSTHEHRWHIVATYHFQNTTDKSATAQVGFPEPRCSVDTTCDEKRPNFIDLETRVKGKKVAHRPGKISPTKETSRWHQRIERVHLFDMTVAPGETVEVVHRFDLRVSSIAGGTILMDYLTTTGRSWAGKIGKARFVVRLPWRPTDLSYPQELKLLRDVEERRGGHNVTELVFGADSWEPNADFSLALGYGWATAIHFNYESDEPGGPLEPVVPAYYNCPTFETLTNRSMRRTSDAELLADPESRSESCRFDCLPIASELAVLDENALKLCRNLPYAVHGRRFQSKALQKAFYGQSKLMNLLDEDAGALLRVNPSYSDALLLPLDRAYTKALDREIKRRLKQRGKQR